MKFKALFFISSCLISIPVWSWDMQRIGKDEKTIQYIGKNDEAMIRDARELSRTQTELRVREQDFIERLTKKIDSLEKQVEKQNEVISTYEKLVISLKAELEKEKKNGR